MVGRVLLPARILTDTTACRIRIDATGVGHAVLTTQYELLQRAPFLRGIPRAKVERKMVTAKRAELRARYEVEMGRSNGHTERHAAARAEGTHGEETTLGWSQCETDPIFKYSVVKSC